MTAGSSLPRVWWFPPISSLDRTGEDGGTYWAYPLDAQPTVQKEADPDLTWLSEQPEASEWGLDSTDATPVRRLVADELSAILCGLAAPSPLACLTADPELQRRIRSVTGCYFDLGDWLATVEGGGLLLHFLSDQQWVRHWLVLVDGPDEGLVLSSTRPIGFKLPADEVPLPALIPMDGSIDLSVAENSLGCFLYRFWIENEIGFRAFSETPLHGRLADYASAVRGDR